MLKTRQGHAMWSDVNVLYLIELICGNLHEAFRICNEAHLAGHDDNYHLVNA